MLLSVKLRIQDKECTMGPLDIIRTQEAAQIKHMETQRTQYMHEVSNKNFKDMIEKQQSKPKELTKSENPEYRYDAKEKGNNQYTSSKQKQKEKKDEKKKDKSTSLPPKNKGIDIRI